MSRRFSTVLVPTDFSPGADRALDRALALPLAAPAHVIVLHVIPSLTSEADDARKAREILVRAIAARPRHPGIELTPEIASGEPHTQIIAKARALGADLIVMGRHGRRAFRDLFIGSTASRTLRYGDIPVLVVNSDTKGPYRRPLIATGLDDATPRLIELARSLIGPDLRSIPLVHAYHIPYEGLHYVARTTRVEHEIEAAARERMENVLDTLPDRARWHPVIRRGEARAVILSEIETTHADLVVIGTHGRAGLAHVVIGSVAEHVIAAAPCDVLVTRPAGFTFAMP